MFYVYVLRSQKDGKLYTGFTKDLRERIKRHNLGETRATNWRLPVELIYYEAYRDERDAKKRELFLKGGRGRELIKKQLNNYFKEAVAKW